MTQERQKGNCANTFILNIYASKTFYLYKVTANMKINKINI